MPFHSNVADSYQTRRVVRRGFTLIELMVVVGIMILLASMTAATISLTVNGDKVRAGARQVQSYLAGARDRAIYAKAPRGVRFLLDPTNPRTVSSMVYISPTEEWTQGLVQLEREDLDNDGVADNPGSQAMVLRGFDLDGSFNSNNPTGWYSLYSQGLLRDGARVLIPNDSTGTWYTITTDLIRNANSVYPPRLRLTTAYIKAPSNPNSSAVPAFTASDGPSTYKLQLPPSVLPNQEPVLLPKGTVIDLDRCSKTPASPTLATATLPGAWYNTSVTPFVYSNQMDVMFSPRGAIIGTAAGRGLIHFYVADQKDADRGLMPEAATGDKIIVSLFARTGAVSVHHVDVNPIDSIVIPPGITVLDYFKFAETGEVAGK